MPRTDWLPARSILRVMKLTMSGKKRCEVSDECFLDRHEQCSCHVKDDACQCTCHAQTANSTIGFMPIPMEATT